MEHQRLPASRKILDRSASFGGRASKHETEQNTLCCQLVENIQDQCKVVRTFRKEQRMPRTPPRRSAPNRAVKKQPGRRLTESSATTRETRPQKRRRNGTARQGQRGTDPTRGPQTSGAASTRAGVMSLQAGTALSGTVDVQDHVDIDFRVLTVV